MVLLALMGQPVTIIQAPEAAFILRPEQLAGQALLLQTAGTLVMEVAVEEEQL